MKKNELKLEFEYSAHKFTNEINVECIEYRIKPVGALAKFFPDDFEHRSETIESMNIRHALSIIASEFKEAAAYRAGGNVSFSDKASFKNAQGNEITVTPATIELH